MKDSDEARLLPCFFAEARGGCHFDPEMASLGFMKEDVLVDFTLGDMVTVISGAWKDTVGAIKAINESKQTITINVEMFGRETPVELGFAEVKKM